MVFQRVTYRKVQIINNACCGDSQHVHKNTSRPWLVTNTQILYQNNVPYDFCFSLQQFESRKALQYFHSNLIHKTEKRNYFFLYIQSHYLQIKVQFRKQLIFKVICQQIVLVLFCQRLQSASILFYRNSNTFSLSNALPTNHIRINDFSTDSIRDFLYFRNWAKLLLLFDN